MGTMLVSIGERDNKNKLLLSLWIRAFIQSSKELMILLCKSNFGGLAISQCSTLYPPLITDFIKSNLSSLMEYLTM